MRTSIERRRDYTTICNLVYLINRRGEFQVELQATYFDDDSDSVEIFITLNYIEVASLYALTNDDAKMSELISELEKYHGSNYQPKADEVS